MTQLPLMTSEPETQSEPDPHRKTVSILGLVKDVFPILSQLTAFIIIGGFVVVQSHIAQITDLFTYNISVGQYLAAGISLIFYVPILIFIQFLQSVPNALVILGVGAVLVAIYVSFYVLRHRNSQKKINKSIEEALENVSRFIVKLQPFGKAYNYFTLGYLIVYAILIGLLYGKTYYAKVPRWLGGGQPAPVVLIFNKNVDVSAMPFAVTNSRSSVVSLITELTDGVLIWDDNSNTAVKVKSEILDGVVGAAPGKSPEFHSPTPIIQSTKGTPIPTISPTP